MQADILIQNVSDQCIPNLVAIRTYRPKRVIWIYTPEKADVLQRLQKLSGLQERHQEAWQVDARNSEAMQSVLQQHMRKLPKGQRIVYHLTSGTKSMALQGMGWLMAQKHLPSTHKIGVVMDPNAQSFDAVLPIAKNNMVQCASLSFQDILCVHGSWQQQGSGRSMKTLKNIYEPLAELRKHHDVIMEALKDRLLCSKQEAKGKGFYLRGKGGLPKVVQHGLRLAEEAGIIRQLKIHNNYFIYQQEADTDPIAYIRNTWMEDWVGAVLAKHNDGRWHGGFSSVKVNIKDKGDYQEFDFLGARRNHLVYWSCKNTKEVTSSNLFEVDALRDEVGGRDFHVAGLVHTAHVEHGMRAKAQRLGVHLLHIKADDAEDTLVRVSHT